MRRIFSDVMLVRYLFVLFASFVVYHVDCAAKRVPQRLLFAAVGSWPNSRYDSSSTISSGSSVFNRPAGIGEVFEAVLRTIDLRGTRSNCDGSSGLVPMTRNSLPPPTSWPLIILPASVSTGRSRRRWRL